MCTVRATSSHITAALTAARAVGADGEDAVVLHQHGRRAAAAQRLDDAAADRVVADERERADRDLAAELVGHHRQHARDRLAARRPGGGVRRVGVHDPADLGQLAVDVGVRRGVGRRRVLALDDLAVEVADDHVLGRQVVVGDPARLDDQQVVAGHPRRDVARGPHHQLVAGQLARAGRTTSRAQRGDRRLRRRRRRSSTPPVRVDGARPRRDGSP